MVFDLDAWEERAAIMEYDAGMSRFRAETMAARQQGVERHEAIRIRNLEQARHQRQADERHGSDNLPGVQPPKAEKERPVSVGNVSAGWGAGVLPPLRMEDGRILR